MKREMVVAIVAACMCGLVIDASGEARVLRVEIGGLTPAGALGEIRMARVAGYGGAWEVHVAAGMHELCETLEIAPGDSGTPDAPVTWVGEDGATLCGGRVIDGWKVRPDGLWEVAAFGSEHIDTALLIQSQGFWYNARMRKNRFIVAAFGSEHIVN